MGSSRSSALLTCFFDSITGLKKNKFPIWKLQTALLVSDPRQQFCHTFHWHMHISSIISWQSIQVTIHSLKNVMGNKCQQITRTPFSQTHGLHSLLTIDQIFQDKCYLFPYLRMTARWVVVGRIVLLAPGRITPLRLRPLPIGGSHSACFTYPCWCQRPIEVQESNYLGLHFLCENLHQDVSFKVWLNRCSPHNSMQSTASILSPICTKICIESLHYKG